MTNPLSGKVQKARRYLGTTIMPDEKPGVPKSRSIDSEDPISRFMSDRTAMSQAKRNYKIYEKGGEIAIAIDGYALYAVTSEPKVRSEDEKDQEILQEWWENIDGVSFLQSAVRWALIFGNGVFERVKSKDKSKIVRLKYVDGRSVTLRKDKAGDYAGVTQHFRMKKNIILEADETVNICLFPGPDNVIGMSLISRNEDNIKKKVMIDDGIANAINRHGFPKYQIKVHPLQEGMSVSQKAIDDAEKVFQDINAKNEFVTDNLIDIMNIDSNTNIKAKDFGEWVLTHLISGFGVPEEMLGLGRGSTEATARVKKEIFEKFINAIRHKLNKQVTHQLLEPMREMLGLKKDSKMWLEFPDINPITELQKAEWIAKLMPSSDAFAILTRDEIREKMGFGPYPEEEEEEPPEEEIPMDDILSIIDDIAGGLNPDDEVFIIDAVFKAKHPELYKKVRSFQASKKRPPDERTKLTEKFQIEGLVRQEGKLVSKLTEILLEIEDDLISQMKKILSKKEMQMAPPDPDVTAAILKMEISKKHKKAIETILAKSMADSWDMGVEATLTLLNAPILPVADEAAMAWIQTQGPIIQGRITGTVVPKLKSEITMGLRNGESIGGISNRMSKVFEGTRSEMDRIARTEVQRASNEARLSAYEQNQIDKVEFLVTDDDMTCEECLSYDGKILKIDEARNLIPIHPNCRCTYMPKVI